MAVAVDFMVLYFTPFNRHIPNMDFRFSRTVQICAQKIMSGSFIRLIDVLPNVVTQVERIARDKPKNDQQQGEPRAGKNRIR